MANAVIERKKKEGAPAKDSLLNEKQKAFCREYILDFNATRACIMAGYSKATAKQMGWENLTKPYIKEYIEKLIDTHTSTINQERARLKRRIEDTAFSDLEEVALRDKLKAQELLGKHLGLFLDRIELSGSVESVALTPAQRKERIKELELKRKNVKAKNAK